ncbi:MAG: flavin reductase family protein [Candidatus Caldarchaeum sp.]
MSQVAEVLKRFMRSYPQGVTIATTMYRSRPWGITLSSFTSISLEPPLVMISVSKNSKTHEAFTCSDNFAVNMLSPGQEQMADNFAGKIPQEERFETVSYRVGVSGAPILVSASAYLDCRRWRVYDGGDHSIIIGEVVDGDVTGRLPPLVYYNRRYTTVAAAYLEAVMSPDFW